MERWFAIMVRNLSLVRIVVLPQHYRQPNLLTFPVVDINKKYYVLGI